MRFVTHDENDIRWMHSPDNYEAGPTIRRIKDAGKWDEFLAIHQDEDGNVDTDALYDYLRHESEDALLDVGLHENEGTATVEDVLKAWEEANESEGLKVSRINAPGMQDDGKPTGLSLFQYNGGETSLEFDSINADGEVEQVSLDEDEVLELVNFKANNNATEGAWDCTDEATAEFEMWRGR